MTNPHRELSNFLIRDLAKCERPREKLLTRGPQNLKDEELLAILLRTGSYGQSSLKLAKKLLVKYPKKKLLSVSFEELTQIKGIGPSKATLILAARELMKRSLSRGEETIPIIQSPKDVISQVSFLRDKHREHFVVLFLNARNQLITKKDLFIGTLNANLVHPREIFSAALKYNAAALILIHNHPSGDPEPSQDDLEITKRLVEAAKIMGLEIIDHLIISQESYFSFKEHQLFESEM